VVKAGVSQKTAATAYHPETTMGKVQGPNFTGQRCTTSGPETGSCYSDKCNGQVVCDWPYVIPTGGLCRSGVSLFVSHFVCLD
jgi:hypothetical protein